MESNKELAAKLEESEKRRMERWGMVGSQVTPAVPSVLADADSSAVREAVASLALVAENVQSKTEQVASLTWF